MAALRREITMLIGRLEWTIANLHKLLPQDVKAETAEDADPEGGSRPRPYGASMTPDHYRTALKALGLTQVGAGKLLGVSARTAQTYAAEGPSGPAACASQLLLAMSEGDRGKWLA